ncbi:uncharacterized protein EAF01_007510 [Botrytis porri]|uniref:uncharacterized protein n=1 Tax=Botrytis porri TaxID=87229 RepID=UPI0018FF9DDC|nr:uncharacterized protein EAF01_007510 [Botrytis porri]KAF7900208.1 hypothetical protein EAF01_007510 [Botrytis porri]
MEIGSCSTRKYEWKRVVKTRFSTATAPLSIGWDEVLLSRRLKDTLRSIGTPYTHPKAGSQFRAIDLDNPDGLEHSKVCSSEHYDGKDLNDLISRQVFIYLTGCAGSALGTRIAASDTLKRNYSTLEKPDTKRKLPEKNSKARARGLKNLPQKESKVPLTRSTLPRSRKSTSFRPSISRPPKLQSSPTIPGKSRLVESSMNKNFTKNHGLGNDQLPVAQSNTVEPGIPKKQQNASWYEVIDPEWALYKPTLLRAIVYDKPHPIEQPGKLKMVLRDDDSITIKWNE